MEGLVLRESYWKLTVRQKGKFIHGARRTKENVEVELPVNEQQRKNASR